jgi:PhoD related phosphatase
MQFSNMFKNIGRIGIEMYLLFQHHTTLEILRNVSDDTDLFTVTGTGWHFVKFLGPAVAVVGPDTRSERNPHQVMAGPTYQGLFPKLAMLPQSIQHCIMMIAVPLLYPRLDAAEQIASSVATGKKAVTGAYNMLGKVTSSVAGVVGAKGAVGSGFDSVKRAVGKSGLMGGVLSPFGDIDVLDELKDQWTHESKVGLPTQVVRFSANSHPGSRTNLSHPHTSRHFPSAIHSLYLYVRRGQHVRRGSRPRSIPSFGPQDHVSTHFLLRRQYSTAIVRPQITQQQQASLHPGQRSTLHPICPH